MEEVNVQLDEFKGDALAMLSRVVDLVTLKDIEIKELKEALADAEEEIKTVQSRLDDKKEEYDEVVEEYNDFQKNSVCTDDAIILKMPKGEHYDDLNIPLLEELLRLPYEKLKSVVEAKNKHPEYKLY